ncbi:MAG TPA: DUF167 domain-containing protein [Candidatus Paceibacterota bacterium]|nr:DUF167 domain-containing protein [Candidatus Paceibacterota bacterium]
MIRITVHVKPGARRASVQEDGPNEYTIAVIARPEHGRATDAVRRALADTLKVAPSCVSLVMGEASRTKVFEVR